MSDTEEVIAHGSGDMSPAPVRQTRSAAKGGGQANSVIKAKKKTPVKKNKSQKKNSGRPTVASLSVAFDAMQQQSGTNSDEIRDMRGDITRVNSSINNLESMFEKFLSAMDKSPSNNGTKNISSRRSPDITIVESQPGRSNGAALSQPPRNTPRNHRQPAATPNELPSTMPNPAQLVSHQNRDGLIDAQMAREEYSAGHTPGKASANGDILFHKPYVYLDREGVQTERQKLDIRATMSYQEYVSCFLSLLHDTKSHDPADRDDILLHFHAVATDAIHISWPHVRRWTQQIWDHVEKGRCKWSSYTFIQNERVRVCYMNMTQQGGNAAPPRNASMPSSDLRYVLCRDFNSTSGCRNNGSHDDGVVRYLHSCSHCDGIGRKSSHSYQRCRIRLDSYGNHQGGSGQHSEGWQWQNQSRSGAPTSTATSQHHGNKYGGYQQQGHSKNG